jgi:hypothetical protein
LQEAGNLKNVLYDEDKKSGGKYDRQINQPMENLPVLMDIHQFTVTASSPANQHNIG